MAAGGSALVRAGRALLAAGALLAAATVAGLVAADHLDRDVIVVMSGSMRPELDAGDAIVVSHPAVEDLRPGMVVTYHAPGAPGRLTTHRIVALRPRAEGLHLQTKGDANPASDPDFVPASSVIGVVDHHLPGVGRWIVLSQRPITRLVLFGAPLLALTAGELVDVTRSWRRRPVRRPASLRGAGLAALTGLAVLGGVVVARHTTATFADVAAVPGNVFTTGASFCGGGSAYASGVLADGPSRYHRLGELDGTTALDSAADPHHGTYRGSRGLGQAGALGCDADTAARFDGTTSWVSSTHRVNDPRAYTVEIWFKTATGGGKLIGFGNARTGSSNKFDRHLYLTDDGRVVFGAGAAPGATVVSPATYLDDRWHLATGTMGADGMALYVDGALVGRHASTASWDYQGYWRIGFDSLDGWADRPSRSHFAGVLDEAAVYDRALPAATVADRFAAAGPGGA